MEDYDNDWYYEEWDDDWQDWDEFDLDEFDWDVECSSWYDECSWTYCYSEDCSYVNFCKNYECGNSTCYVEYYDDDWNYLTRDCTDAELDL